MTYRVGERWTGDGFDVVAFHGADPVYVLESHPSRGEAEAAADNYNGRGTGGTPPPAVAKP